MDDRQWNEYVMGNAFGVGRGVYGGIGNANHQRTQEVNRQAKRVQAQTAALPASAAQSPAAPRVQGSTGQRTAGQAGPGLLDKVVKYAAIVLALLGGGYGLSVTSSPIGATVGAGLGFAAPYLLRGTIVGTANFVLELLPTATKLLLLGGAGFVLYLLAQ